MTEEIKCIICNQNSIIALENFKGYQEGGSFNICYCQKCNTSFAWPHLVDHKIYDLIYSQPEIVPGYNRYEAYANDVAKSKNALEYLANKEANYYSIKEILNQKNDKTIKILEVGSGLGYLTFSIAQMGYDITGLDISADAAKKAEMKFGKHFICQDVYKFALENSGKFDLIILTEVIEHVSEPKDFCSVLINLLKNGGSLVITTPNKSANPPEDYWDTESPPVHLTWFSEDSFKIISEQMGLSLSFFDFSAFNKKHIDITRFKFYERFYKRKNRDYTLNREGKVISPVMLNRGNGIGKLKADFKKFIKPMYESLFISLLTHNKNPERNTCMCVILQKKA